MLYPFSALLARMKYITRWSLMHSTRAESLSEHTCDTALLAHMLCLIARRYTGTPCRPKTVAVAALYHDAPEIITGDLPTPVKYNNPEICSAYKSIEHAAADSLLRMLPEELRPHYRLLMTMEEQDPETYRYIKAADKISAYIKCVEELRSGNDEFRRAAEQTRKAIRALELPEADLYMEQFAPAFALNLDELQEEQQ